MSSYWHPFAAMGAVEKGRLVLERAEGVWVWDSSGRRYLDATASLWCVNVGHGREEIIEAIARQMRRLDTYQTFGDFANEPVLELAQTLSSLAPMADAKVFLGSGGGDGIEAAAKLAISYFARLGLPERRVLIGRTHAYHGTHGYGTALGGIEANNITYAANPDVVRVPHDDPRALEEKIAECGRHRVAAFFLEPVIGAGGVHPPAPGYIEAVADICRRYGVLLIADAVIAGFGRLGCWFGIERFGVAPDIVVFAKGVTSGYLPLGGILVSGRVAGPFWEEDAPPFRHGVTYAGHPAACAAAITNLAILERENLLDRATGLEGTLLLALEPLVSHPLVSEVRGGVGLLAGVELDPDALAARPRLPVEIAIRAREGGVLLRATTSALATSPPLTVAEAEIEMIAAALAASLVAVDRTVR